jgi:hypothetical protein
MSPRDEFLVWRVVRVFEAVRVLLNLAGDTAQARCEYRSAARYAATVSELDAAQAGLLEVLGCQARVVSPTVDELGEVLAPAGLWST